MPGAKRITKTVSYAEHDDDDDDFVSKVDAKKTRNAKPNERPVEPKLTTRQPPRKRNEKLTKNEQAEIDLAIKLSKDEETVQLSEISIELPNLSNDKHDKNVSSNESKTTDEEILLPKSKRMKREEEEEVIIEEVKKNDESNSEEEIDEDEEEEEKEEENDGGSDDDDEEEKERQQSPPRKKTIRKSDESQKPIENITRLVTRNQQKPSLSSSSISTTEQIKKKVNVPVGFPTSKINIPSVQPSRVGLSRRSGAIKPLHPNLNPRIAHE